MGSSEGERGERGLESIDHRPPAASLHFPALPCLAFLTKVNDSSCSPVLSIHIMDGWEGDNVVGCCNHPSALPWGL